MKREFRIKNSENLPFIPKFVKDTYEYLKTYSENQIITVTKDKINDISLEIGYGYNTINQSFTILRNLGFIELLGKSHSKYKRTKHLDFEYGTKEYKKSAYIKHLYNITTKDLENLYKFQDSKCGICKRNEEEIGSKLNIDHDHKTGKVRGLLCNPCNTSLGKFKDSKEILENAIKYLENSS